MRNYERRAPAKTRWEIALARMREDETSSGENMVVVSLCGEKGMYCLTVLTFLTFPDSESEVENSDRADRGPGKSSSGRTNILNLTGNCFTFENSCFNTESGLAFFLSDF